MAEPPQPPQRGPHGHPAPLPGLMPSFGGVGSNGASGKKVIVPQVDERCWIKCSQTNWSRSQQGKPRCRALCFMNFRRAMHDLPKVAIPDPSSYSQTENGTATVGTAADGKQFAGTTETAQQHHSYIHEEEDEEPQRYHWPFLDGRFVYFARGRATVQRHMDEMSLASDHGDPWWDVLEKIVERCDEANDKAAGGPDDKGAHIVAVASSKERRVPGPVGLRPPKTKEEVQRALGLDEENYETIIGLSELWSLGFSSIHDHFARIYSPGLRNLARLPETFYDGTQERTLNQIYTKFTDGSAFTLASRILGATSEVIKRLNDSRSRGGPGDGPAGGAGGLGPGGPAPPFGGLGPGGAAAG